MSTTIALLPLNLLGTGDISNYGSAVATSATLAYSDAEPSWADTEGSQSFNGTNGWVSLTGQDYSLGTGDFTVEVMIKNVIESTQYGRIIVDTRPPSANGNYWFFFTDQAGSGVCFYDGANQHNASNCLSASDFNHIAVTRESGTLRIFVDGVLKLETPNVTQDIGANRLVVGQNIFRVAGTYAKCLMTQLRVIKGVALYTADFSPPSQSFVSINDLSMRANIAEYPRLAPGANYGAPLPKANVVKIARQDQIDGGGNKITGTVTISGQPASRRVRLFDQPSGRILGETWSDKITGAYTFDYIRPGTFMVIALDYTGAFDPEAKADLHSEPMA